jgi:hypothetical protein
MSGVSHRGVTRKGGGVAEDVDNGELADLAQRVSTENGLQSQLSVEAKFEHGEDARPEINVGGGLGGDRTDTGGNPGYDATDGGLMGLDSNPEITVFRVHCTN